MHQIQIVRKVYSTFQSSGGAKSIGMKSYQDFALDAVPPPPPRRFANPFGLERAASDIGVTLPFVFVELALDNAGGPSGFRRTVEAAFEEVVVASVEEDAANEGVGCDNFGEGVEEGTGPGCFEPLKFAAFRRS